ncbi:MAG: hypothetical protein KKH83_05770 [Candidatus Margulisbacteria bacterium]|nr:hypothetical protein [Candidatus Margulisiibacteriota bacterium]
MRIPGNGRVSRVLNMPVSEAIRKIGVGTIKLKRALLGESPPSLPISHPERLSQRINFADYPQRLADEAEDRLLMKDGLRIALNQFEATALDDQTDYFLHFEAVPQYVAEVFAEAIGQGLSAPVLELLRKPEILDMMKGTEFEGFKPFGTYQYCLQVMQKLKGIEHRAATSSPTLSQGSLRNCLEGIIRICKPLLLYGPFAVLLSPLFAIKLFSFTYLVYAVSKAMLNKTGQSKFEEILAESEMIEDTKAVTLFDPKGRPLEPE